MPLDDRSTDSGAPRILLLGDEHGRAVGLFRYLSSQGYHVSIGQDDPAAVGQVIVTGGGVIVLDIGPPMEDWRCVLHALRCDIQTRAPILVLAAQTELDERLHAFTLGADDFLQEPFALPEVRARIDALHRRVTNTVVRGTASTYKPVANSLALSSGRAHPSKPVLSVIIPARDEAQNLPSLLDEIAASLDSIEYEILVVDDGSVDHTWPLLVSRAGKDCRIRPLRHFQAVGQSTSMWQAATLARGEWLVTLDGDGQNDPADVPRLFTRARQERLPLVAGHRVRRQDDRMKRLSSRMANRFRSLLLGDGTPDTGCGLKVIERSAFLRLPYFDHMHRFLPALIQAQGGRCVSVPVSHRPRRAGRSHYGVNNRLWVGLVDIVGVMWLRRRSRLPAPLHGVRDLQEHSDQRDLELAGGGK